MRLVQNPGQVTPAMNLGGSIDKTQTECFLGSSSEY
jgi:hypothetical protein